MTRFVFGGGTLDLVFVPPQVDGGSLAGRIGLAYTIYLDADATVLCPITDLSGNVIPDSVVRTTADSLFGAFLTVDETLTVVYATTPGGETVPVHADIPGRLAELQNKALRRDANLADLDTPADARDNLGLGSAATHDAADFEAPDHLLYRVRDHGFACDAVELTNTYIDAGTQTLHCPDQDLTTLGPLVGKAIAIPGANTSGNALTTNPANNPRTVSAVLDAHTLTFDDALLHVAASTTVVAQRTSAGVIVNPLLMSVLVPDASLTASDVGKTIHLPGVGGYDVPILLAEEVVTSAGSPVVTLSEPWNQIGPEIAVGQLIRVDRAGASFTNRGAWAPATAYNPYDTVTNGGVTYFTVKSFTSGGSFDATNWMVSGATINYLQMPLFAKVVSVDSPTQITLDTNAARAVTNVRMYDLGQPTTLAVTITRVISATQCKIRRRPDLLATVTATIDGHTAVVGTNDGQVLADFLANNIPGTLKWRPGEMSLIAAGLPVIDRRGWTFEGSGKGSGLHVGATAGRLTTANGGDDFTARNMEFRGLSITGVIQLWLQSGSVGVAVRNHKFIDCLFYGVSPQATRPGRVTNAGTVVANGSGHAQLYRLIRCEVTRIYGNGIDAQGVEGVLLDHCDVHHNGVDVNSGEGIKIGTGTSRCTSRTTRSYRNVRDGMDIYDSVGTHVDGGSYSWNGEFGIDNKWNATNDYNTPGSHRFTSVEAIGNGSVNLHMNSNNSTFMGCVAHSSMSHGARLADETTPEVYGTRYSVVDGLVATSNAGDGFSGGASGGPKKCLLANMQLHGNGGWGGSFGGSDHIISSIQAYDNVNGGVQTTATSTRIEFRGSKTQDANGACVITSGATFITVNGYGEEAAGSGNQPSTSFANWPLGTRVKNLSDSTYWMRASSGWTTLTGAAGPSGDTAPSGWKPADYGYQGWAFDLALTSTSTVPTIGTKQTVRIPIRAVPASALTDVLLAIITIGASLTNCYVELWQNGVRLGYSADQSTTWSATTGLKAATLTADTGQSLIPAVGFVDVVFWVGTGSTTAPAFGRNGSGAALNGGLATTDLRYATAGTGASTPAAAGSNPTLTKTSASTAFWAGVR